jgi:molybdopterin synthase sulfur carrier subunit
MSVRLRYFAAAKAALGRSEEERPSGVTIAELLAALVAETSTADAAAPGPGPQTSPAAASPTATASPATDPATLERLLARCTFIHNRTSTDDRTLVLQDGDTLDVLPPFAGG